MNLKHYRGSHSIGVIYMHDGKENGNYYRVVLYWDYKPCHLSEWDLDLYKLHYPETPTCKADNFIPAN